MHLSILMHNVLPKSIFVALRITGNNIKLPTPEQNSTTGRITPKTNIPIHMSHLLSAAMSRKGIYFFERGEGRGS